MNNFQRIGSISNAHAGRDFEEIAKEYFESAGLPLEKDYSVAIGFDRVKKNHKFDLGGKSNENIMFVVECKSHKWTSGDKVPSAKITVWNEAMLYFSLLSEEINKISFVLKDKSHKRQETLAEYYIRTHNHLIPKGVKIMEYDDKCNEVSLLYNS